MPIVSENRDNSNAVTYDKYARRSINWLYYGLMRAFSLVLRGISLSFTAKPSEIVSVLSGYSLGIFVALLFFIINRVKLKQRVGVLEREKRETANRELRFAIIFSGIYWIVAILIQYGFEKVFVLNILDFAIAVFLIWMIAYNIWRMRQIAPTTGRYAYAVIGILFAIAALGIGYQYLSRDIWLTQPYINSIPNIYQGNNRISYNEENGVYTITKTKNDFKILQLTDIHLGGGVLSYDKDLKALQSVYKLIEAAEPDLVIVTGDLSYPVGLSSFSFNNTAPVQQFAAFMRNIGVPWAFVYGNHDTESIAATSTETLNELYKTLSYKTGKTLLYPYVQPDITGRNNQLIEVRNEDGTLNQILFLMDSNAYVGSGFSDYDYIHEDQVEWYESELKRITTQEKKIVPSLVFFHIPLQEYKTAYELYEEGSIEVNYFFGSNEEPEDRRICCSNYPSTMFDKALELGSTTGFFCGHDHLNNMSLEYKGIRLTYGMSIDYLATPGIARKNGQRGGTVITIHKDGTTDIRQLRLQ